MKYETKTMTIGEKTNPLLLLFCLLLSGLAVDALSYDYSFALECLANPHKPQYDGGIVSNPGLDQGLKGWTKFGDSNIEQRVSKGGNAFIVARHRHQSHDSFSQKFHLEKGKFYTFSAWLQVSQGNATVAAIFKTKSGFHHAGWVEAKFGCWSMLKGGLTVNASGPADLYFESKNTGVEIWADSVSLQPFTNEEWRSHQHQSIEKARKSWVKVIAVDGEGNPLANATMSLVQQRPNFPFGCAISYQIISNTAYQNWFTSRRFTVTTFENEMKWDATERFRGREDYSVPDAMLRFAQRNNVRVRGHNVVWDNPQFVPQWAKSLPPNDLRFAVDNRINSLVRRYAGQLIAWDVENENMHFNFFESVLGRNTSAYLYSKVNQIDSRTTLFLNEYNTIEEPGDGLANPTKYLAKIQEIRAGGYRGLLGIGLQAHFSSAPNLPYVRASIDKLAATGLPIWLTEVDVVYSSNQASYLEQVLREAHGYPRVNGIVIWAARRPEGCFRMCLTDNNFRNLPTGDVVDKLLREWGQTTSSATTDSSGRFETKLFHGDYKVTVTHTNKIKGSSVVTQSFKVEDQPKTIHVKVLA